MLDKITLGDIFELFSTGDPQLDKKWILFSVAVVSLARFTVFDPEFQSQFLGRVKI